MTSKTQNGIKWARWNAWCWFWVGVFKTLAAVGNPALFPIAIQALFVSLFGAIFIGIPAFALGWLFGKDEQTV